VADRKDGRTVKRHLVRSLSTPSKQVKKTTPLCADKKAPGSYT
jgi:hypothetical protein